ncbi:MAG: hypothetical protein IT374_20430 [Polyangiaceae bacterium]|nr:hypothetical protein [Polyangiaceae bacterium]
MRAVPYALIVASLVGAAGCASGNRPPARARPPAVAVAPLSVDDAHFAETVHGLLVDGSPTLDRQARLGGAVRRQLAHATERLRARERERGVASLFGALYLVRAGELTPGMLDGSSSEALALAVEAVAARGDEGRSAALYELQKLAAPAGPAARDADEHLAALERWAEETTSTGAGDAERAGAEQRRKAARSLLLPTDDGVKDAVGSAARWIDAGIELQERMRERRDDRPRREDALESIRAVTSGAATIAAIFLRHGDAAGAHEALSRAPAERVAPPGLVLALQRAARGEAAAWRDLLELFARPERPDDESGLDRSLVRAAAFGVAIEAYRKSPAEPEVAMHLSSALAGLGMVEVAPLVLADAAEKSHDARLVGAMLEAVGASIAREEADGDPQSARRTFAASSRLLATAERAEFSGKLTPSPSRLRLLGAGTDARAGELSAAKANLALALAREPLADAKALLAEIERAQGNRDAALALYREVAASPEARSDRGLEAEARVAVAQLLDEAGSKGADAELSLAAQAAVEARRVARSAHEVSRAERLLARVLDRTSDPAGAARARERALLAARASPRDLATTVLEAVAHAYVARDLASARKAAAQMVGAGLHDDEIVYAALWLQSLERELGAKPDGTAALLFDRVEPGASWPARLTAFARGQLGEVELTAAARTAAQRTEATFYRALARRAKGEADAATPALREVAAAPTLSLVETQIARGLLAPRRP